MKKTIWTIVVLAFVSLILYGSIGTGTRVDTIKKRVPLEVAQRNWKILRYEGYQWGSFDHHGGSVYYHVCNIDNPNIQYRINVSLWNDELQWYYDAPENLSRFNVNINSKDIERKE